MTILEILNKIEATRSKKEKVAIMTQHKDNADLKAFFYMCLHPRINFFQKKEIEFTPIPNSLTFSLASAMEVLLQDIADRKVTGHAARDLIAATMSALVPDDAEVIRRILKKKTGCGVDSSVNDVWTKLIPEHPNLLASPYSTKLAEALNWKKGVITERKSDGLRVSVHVQEDSVTIYSRAGNVLDLHGRFNALALEPAMFGRVLDCELMVVKADGKFEDRKTGNGILNSLNSNKLNRMKDDLCMLQMKLQELKRESEDFQIT